MQTRNENYHEKNRLARQYSWMSPQDIATELSAREIVDIFGMMLKEIDRLLKVQEEYCKLQDDLVKRAGESSLNMLKAVLAGTQVNLPKEQRDPETMSFIEGK